MYEFQEEGIAWLRGGARRYLGDDPGLGKTRQALLAAEGHTLVVAPAMLMGVWAEEASKWAPDLDWYSVPYSSLCTTKKGPKGGNVALPVPRSELTGHWDTIIFDEAHYLKGRNTNWTKAALKLKADRIWQLSGTPLPNWAQEAFIPAQLLHPGDRDFTSYWRWAGNWFNIWEPHWGGRKVGKLRANRTWEQFHEANFGDMFLQRCWDALEHDLPPLRRQTIKVQMTSSQKRFYTDLKKRYVAEIEGTGEQVVAWNSGSLATNLVKASTGISVINSAAGRGSSGKFQVTEGLLESWSGHPSVVVCHFRETARQVASICRRVGREPLIATGEIAPAKRFDIARRFQAGEADVLVATIESIAEGLTITRANRMLFVEKSYRPSRNQQMEKRIWRIGQTSPCLVVDLVTEGTVDEKIRTVLEKKTDQQMRALRRGEFAKLA